MNKDLFRFKHRPFASAPDVANFVPAESIENALESVATGVQRAAGPAVVIGPSGIGKSMFCVELANLMQHSHEIVFLATSRLCTRRALLQNVLYELGLPYRDLEEGELRLSLLEHLKSPQATSDGMLLIVDEAHTMPLRLLEEIRGLTNINRQGQPRVNLVLAGTQLLDERLASPKMDSFVQRIATRTYLHPLQRAETRRFITQQWNQASADGAPLPFSAEAMDAVHDATDGIPRLVNQLSDHALLLANARVVTTFGRELIEEAWADLQQLPAPWQVNFRETDSNDKQTVIEFGTLSGDSPIGDAETEAEQNSTAQLTLQRLEELERLTREVSDLATGIDVDQTPAEPAPEYGELKVSIEEVETDHAESLEREPSQQGEELDVATALEAIVSNEPTISDTPQNSDIVIDTDTDADDKEKANDSRLVGGTQTVANPFADDEFDLEEVITQQRETTASQPIGGSSQTVNSANAFAHDSQFIRPPLAFSGTQQEASVKGDQTPHSATDANADLLPRPGELSPEPSPQGEPAETPPSDSPEAQGENQQTKRDDKDMIVIDNPLPQGSLRVVGAQGGNKSSGFHATGMAYREDYRTLFTRLKGSVNS